MSKKILFVAPSHFEIYKVLIENLEHLGFYVTYLSTDGNFKYNSKKDKFVNLIRKLFLGDKNYKKVTLLNRFQSKDHLNQLALYEKEAFDFSLVIRALPNVLMVFPISWGLNVSIIGSAVVATVSNNFG